MARPIDVMPSPIPSQPSTSMPRHTDSRRWCLREFISVICFCKQNVRASGLSSRLGGKSFGIVLCVFRFKSKA